MYGKSFYFIFNFVTRRRFDIPPKQPLRRSGRSAAVVSILMAKRKATTCSQIELVAEINASTSHSPAEGLTLRFPNLDSGPCMALQQPSSILLGIVRKETRVYDHFCDSRSLYQMIRKPLSPRGLSTLRLIQLVLPCERVSASDHAKVSRDALSNLDACLETLAA